MDTFTRISVCLFFLVIIGVATVIATQFTIDQASAIYYFHWAVFCVSLFFQVIFLCGYFSSLGFSYPWDKCQELKIFSSCIASLIVFAFGIFVAFTGGGYLIIIASTPAAVLLMDCSFNILANRQTDKNHQGE